VLWLAVLLLLAIAPDLDYAVPGLRSAAPGGLRVTHPVTFALAFPLLVTLALALTGCRGELLRQRGTQAVLAGLSHLLLDSLVGVTPAPLLWPFHDARFRLPFGVLPSAGRLHLANPLLWRNLFINEGRAAGHGGTAGTLRRVRVVGGDIQPVKARSTGLEPVDERGPKPATAHAFRGIASESGHFESTEESSPVPPVPRVPSSLGDILETKPGAH
jgi:hypothetical protein